MRRTSAGAFLYSVRTPSLCPPSPEYIILGSNLPERWAVWKFMQTLSPTTQSLTSEPRAMISAAQSDAGTRLALILCTRRKARSETQNHRDRCFKDKYVRSRVIVLDNGNITILVGIMSTRTSRHCDTHVQRHSVNSEQHFV